MAIDFTGFAFPKARDGKLRVEEKRDKRLVDDWLEREARQAARKLYGYHCGVPGCKESGSELHHIVRRSRSKARRWQLSNLCWLCRGHHALEHTGRIHISRNEQGELIVTGARRDLAFRL